MALPISVVVPLGPDPHYLTWLDECIQSIYDNDPDEIILIDDISALSPQWIQEHSDIKYFRNPWLCGCSMSWNFGVSYSKNELVFLMGSDDIMLPFCLEICVNAYETHNQLDAWYNVTVELENGELSDAPNNAAAVTRGLWKLTGGFGPSAFAAPDAWLLSIMLKHMPQRIIQVDKGVPYYKCRSHPYQDTSRQFGRFFDAAHSIRDIATREWRAEDFEWTERVK